MKKIPKRRRKARRASRHVLLLLGSYYRRNHEGIARYAKEHGWTLDVSYVRQGRFNYTPRVDGIISLITTPRDLEALRLLPRAPQVDISKGWGSESLPDTGGVDVPRVLYDNPGIGRIAASHFIGHGIEHIALFNQGNFWNERERRVTFEAAVREAGRVFHELPHYRWLAEDGSSDPNTKADRMLRRLEEELKRLPKPVGVFAPSDDAGVMVLQACQEAALRVPDDVAVLGCHNARMVCEFASVPLSSVDDDLPRQGYEAARLLDRLMDGEQPPAEPVIVPVKGVVTRASTDILAVERADVKAALRYIVDHYREPLQIREVARAARVSPRTLSMLFKRHLDSTVGKEIARRRIARAKELLTQTNLKAWDVALQAGFSSIEHLSRAFTRIVGENPSRYRQRHP